MFGFVPFFGTHMCLGVLGELLYIYNYIGVFVFLVISLVFVPTHFTGW